MAKPWNLFLNQKKRSLKFPAKIKYIGMLRDIFLSTLFLKNFAKNVRVKMDLKEWCLYVFCGFRFQDKWFMPFGED